MKRLFVLSTLVFSFNSFSQATVDFSQCQQALGFMAPQLDQNGEFSKEGSEWGYPAPDIETKKLETGSRITYTYKRPWINGKSYTSTFVIEKDKDGKLIKYVTGGDTMDPQAVTLQKQTILESAVYSGLPAEAIHFNFNKDEASRLSKANRSDSKNIQQIREGYSKLLEKSDVFVPNGSELEVAVKDGKCSVNKVSNRYYNPKTKVNKISSSVTREYCDSVTKVYKKYEKALSSCATTNQQMSKELFELGGQDSVYPGGGYVGGAVGGINGGAFGGAVGGINGGGMGGGYGYPGMAFGMGGYGYGDSFMCQSYFGQMPQGGWGGYGQSPYGTNPKKQDQKSVPQ